MNYSVWFLTGESFIKSDWTKSLYEQVDCFCAATAEMSEVVGQ